MGQAHAGPDTFLAGADGLMSDGVRAMDWRKALRIAGGSLIALTMGLTGPAFALPPDVIHAEPGAIGLLPPETAVARELDFFHNDILLPLIIIISLFVLVLLAIVVVRFNERANPVPSRTTHHALLEVAWTVVPVLILVGIAVPSFRLLNRELILPKGDMTMKVTGHQWYWSYEYPKDEGGGFSFDSLMKPEAELKPGELRLLAVDNEAVVPIDKIVRLQVVGADVIHSFVIQPFGIRVDAVPGRLNETWFKAEREGLYYGQCSKLCGKDHAFMPIAFRVVSQARYEAWLADSKKKYAAGASATRLADAQPHNDTH
jgi:cytochrome c oxidase subunit 2